MQLGRTRLVEQRTGGAVHGAAGGPRAAIQISGDSDGLFRENHILWEQTANPRVAYGREFRRRLKAWPFADS